MLPAGWDPTKPNGPGSEARRTPLLEPPTYRRGGAVMYTPAQQPTQQPVQPQEQMSHQFMEQVSKAFQEQAQQMAAVTGQMSTLMGKIAIRKARSANMLDKQPLFKPSATVLQETPVRSEVLQLRLQSTVSRGEVVTHTLDCKAP